MARVNIYERPVDAVLTDVTLHDKDNYPKDGIKIKEEPPDLDTENSYENLLIDQSAETTIANGSSLPENQVSINPLNKSFDHLSEDRTNNKENELVQSGNVIDVVKEKPGNMRILRKRSMKEGVKEQIQPPKRRKPNIDNVTAIQSTVLPANVTEEDTGKDMSLSKPSLPQSTQIECEECFMTFSAIQYLNRHLRKYRNPWMYSCSVCSLSFHSRYDRTRHVRNCKRIDKYVTKHKSECHFCGRTYNLKSTLQCHLFHMHKDLIYSPENMKTTGRIEENESEVNTIIQSPVRATVKSEIVTPSSVKKMRQTTLTEFLQSANRSQEEEQLDQVKNLENVSVSDTIHTTPSSTRTKSGKVQQKSSKHSKPSSSANAKPFVQFFADTDQIIALLKDSMPSVKTETQENCDTPTSSRTRTYSFRPGRRSSIRNSDNSVSSKQSSQSGKPMGRHKDNRPSHGKNNEAWKRKVKTTFKCKECSVVLVRCDEELKKKVESKVHTTSLSDSLRSLRGKLINTTANIPGNAIVDKLKNQVELQQQSTVSEQKKSKTTAVDRNSQIVTTSKESAVKLPVPDKFFQCKVCKKSFSSKENMREHMELFHVAYISSICEARFTTRGKLLNHYLRQHAVFKRNKCCVCEETFDRKAMLKQHMILHCIKILRSQKDDKPIDVDMRCNLFRKPYKCTSCRKRFWLYSCLKQHLIVCRRKNELGSEKEIRVKSSPGSIHGDTYSPIDHPMNEVPVIPIKTSPSTAATMDHAQNQVSLMTDKIVPSADTQKTVSIVPDRLSIQATTSPPKQINNGASSAVKRTIWHNVNPGAGNKVKYPCSICGKQFQTFQNLAMHERTFSKPADIHCTICGTAFPTKRLLQLHVSATHMPAITQTFKFHCKFCNQGFYKKTNVRIHELHFHTREYHMTTESFLNNDTIWNINTVCTVCNLMFETYDRFIEHNMYYYKGHSFTCTFCGQTVQGMYMLHHHNKLVHYPEQTRQSYTYNCDICNEGFNHQSHFHAHKLHVHLNESAPPQNALKTAPAQSMVLEKDKIVAGEAKQLPITAYTCNTCNMHFTSKKDLTLHEMEYSPDGDFHCNKCTRRCCSLAVLIKHQSLNHTGSDIDSSYKCCFCGEVMTTSVSMMCHVKHFHNNDDVHSRLNSSAELKSSSRVSVIKDGPLKKFDANDNYTCLTCGMRFENEISLKDHLLDYSDIGAYSCNVCHRKFVELHRLEAHKFKHSRLNGVLSDHHCPICHEGFTTVTNVRTHVMHLHGHETFQNLFDKRTKNSKSSEMQLQSSEVSSAVARNSVAQRRSPATEDRVCSSVATKEADAIAYDAPTTKEKWLKDPLPIIAPMNAIANQPRTGRIFKCSECDMEFNNAKNLSAHKMRYKNGGDYVCDFCGRRFAWETSFLAHYQKHSMPNISILSKHQCPYCDERFRSFTAMHAHMCHVHGKNNRNNANQSDSLKKEKFSPNQTNNLMEEVLLENEVNWESSNESIKDPLEISPDESPQVIDTPNQVKNGIDKSLETRPSKSGVNVTCLARPKESTVLPSITPYYTCPICIIVYSTLKEFQRHFKATHPSKRSASIQLAANSNIIECMICDAAFTEESKFKIHMSEVHMPRICVNGTPPQDTPAPDTDDNDGIEVIWQKKRNTPVIVKTSLNESFEENLAAPKVTQAVASPSTSPLKQTTSNSDVPNIQGHPVREHRSQKPVEQPKSPETSNVGKLKVKPFAKIIENLYQTNGTGPHDKGESTEQENPLIGRRSQPGANSETIAQVQARHRAYLASYVQYIGKHGKKST